MTHTRTKTNRFGSCLVICAPTHTHIHTHTHIDIAQVLRDYPAFKLWLGGCLSFHPKFFTVGGGGLENCVHLWQGVLVFFHMCSLSCIQNTMKLIYFDVAAVACYALQCCVVV